MMRLGVDIGGTFTDFVALDADTGRAIVWKRLTTPDDPSESVVAGVEDLLREHHLAPQDASVVIHGTTLVANAIIERKGALTGLVATEGHRDGLEIGRELRYDIYDFFIERPAPLVPRHLRAEVRERLAADGRVLLPVDDAGLRAVADHFRGLGVRAVAVCLLHSYVNPAHEEHVGRVLAAELPGVALSLSSRIAPEIREYERASTAAANAYVQPLVSHYLARLRTRFAELLPRAGFYVMLSNGGLATPERATVEPIQLVESGPAAGALAACHYAAGAGYQDVLAFDMGGTTAKMCVIAGGVPARTHETEIARRQRFKRGSGLPLRVPTIHLIEIGAGGGSIARADRLGLLKVGPDSAGAQPGPACYARGGDQPTVTDATLILGYLDPGFFLGGKMALDQAAAERALARLAPQLGLSTLEVARGVHDVVNENMALAARRHVTEQARDPRRHALVAFGGCGPIHAYGLARRLKMSTIICPPAAGAASALGCLAAPAAVELARSRLTALDDTDWSAVRALYAALEEEARRILADAQVRAGEIVIQRSADMRYVGQGYEVAVPLPDGCLDQRLVPRIVQAFDESYERRFGQLLTDVPLEALTWRLTARGPAPVLNVSALSGGDGHGSALKGSRPAYFAEAQGYVSCAVLDRYALRPGDRIAGPAIIEERESTVVVGPAGSAVVDEQRNVVITLPEELEE